MDIEALTPAAQDCLKAIWRSVYEYDQKVTTSGLAAELGVAVSSASEMIGRLEKQGLVDHPPYAAVALTESGRKAALSVVRRHRLIETFLVEKVGYTWDEVHEEAEVLEHAVSDRFTDRIDAVLGYPRTDPHGDPIPNGDGEMPAVTSIPLSDVPPGSGGQLSRISDRYPELLRYLASKSIQIGTWVQVLERREQTGAVRLQVRNGASDVYLSVKEQGVVWVDA